MTDLLFFLFIKESRRGNAVFVRCNYVQRSWSFLSIYRYIERDDDFPEGYLSDVSGFQS